VKVYKTEMNIKTAPELYIERLYHYQAFDKKRLTKILNKGTIYFSNPKDFNDPWDCRPCFSKFSLDDPDKYKCTVDWFAYCARKSGPFLSEADHLESEKKLRSDRKLLERLLDEMTLGMEQMIQTRYRVYCLSTHPDSTLM